MRSAIWKARNKQENGLTRKKRNPWFVMLKNFSDLHFLRTSLKQQEAARRKAESERAERARVAALEHDLFRRAVGELTLMPFNDRIEPYCERPLPIARQRLADEKAALAESLSDEMDVETLLDTDQSLSFTRTGVGLDVVRKLRKGHWVIQGELDLHGMRREEARTELADFLHRAGKRGIRCVRVIHGKGLGSRNREPILKQLVYRWLVQKDEVLAFCIARASDGGNGALVVLLKG
jgi:DNA-nicking Smr family endonuclease